jgi:hypothetical protein
MRIHVSIVVEVLFYKPEGHGFETRRGVLKCISLLHPSGHPKLWSLLGL